MLDGKHPHQIRMITNHPSEMIDEPAHPVGWHDNVKEGPVERTEFNGTDEEYEEYCEACAI